jgi:phosphoribosylformylglycinamidine synthase
MAYAMDLAGFDVKDVHMTDLVSGRENLEDINFIVAVGGFSNSDVLGSAKGWAGSFLYNEKAKTSLMNFYKRNDTLSLGVCNGCQLFIELGLLHTEHEVKPKMNHNDSKKFECIFTSVEIQENNSVMFKNLSGSKLGIWSAHGEGKFNLPYSENKYNIVGKYGYNSYPANPNGSDYNTAIISNKDGRHIAMMPHLERSTFPWNWPYYPSERNDEISPWIIAFENAKNWLSNKI